MPSSPSRSPRGWRPADHAIRPTWYLWEDEAFWLLTGPWAKLPSHVRADPAIALVVDVCDLATGLVRQVIARGRAELLPFDVARGRRKLSRYLGHDESRWDRRFQHYLLDDPAKGTVWLRLRPALLHPQRRVEAARLPV